MFKRFLGDGTLNAPLLNRRSPPVMSNKTLLSAMITLAMLALPGTALAGHHRDWDDSSQPFAWHDHGWHRGWFKHQGHGRPAWCDVRAVEDEEENEHCHLRPRYVAPAYSCDADGDDCEPVNQGYESGYDYGPPTSYYEAVPPSGDSLIQQRDWLIQRRQRAYYVLARMQARHDSHAVHRMSTVIRLLNARIARDNQLLAGGGNVPPATPSYGAAYNPNYPTASPAVNALTGIVGPMLGLPPY
jgi:hypothetical protein